MSQPAQRSVIWTVTDLPFTDAVTDLPQMGLAFGLPEAPGKESKSEKAAAAIRSFGPFVMPQAPRPGA